MDSESKEVKQEIAVKVENEDQAVEIAQVAPAFQAEGSAQAGSSTQANHHPPTFAELTANPIGFRRYVRFLADNTPQAPPHLYGKDFQTWQYSHLLTATLDHLVEAFKDTEHPQEEAYRFYQDWLIVNNRDYKDSRFWYRASAKSLFRHEADLRSKCRKMAGG